ncbi:coenzyme PQQ synthesis protein D (PqqD) [Stella humosa]|uniref:Coenzyme PQQ synthesis protein D (PqqD) n=1 Tax=Stella humosa TaxID=94 RepID=A0A3N1LII2_9PROT|nr:PqqD family protein [Stella humosa]ROP90974.1 coenzyme PQQ synthesis protein D (PqqD) [Stella humosa]BBK34676.1 hypothetical protein STHU_53100 [Stella humosa]
MYLSDDTRLVARGNPIVHETLDGEAVIINLKSGTYYSLQGVGAVLWQQIVDSTTVAELRRRIADEAALPADTAAAAIDTFVAGLLGEDLALADPVPAGKPAPSTQLPADLTQLLTLQSFTDVQELLALDPVHDVDEVGWPVKAADLPDPATKA